jgi:predicted HicB family RNase H-like nuclease
MNTMTYKGYMANISYSSEDECFVGSVAGIQDVIGFHGDSVDELRAAFREAVDDYLDACETLDRAPQKPYSGNIMLRIDPGIHAKAAMHAQASGKSLNRWAQEVFATAVKSER